MSFWGLRAGCSLSDILRSRSRLLRRAYRHASSVVTALPALAPRLVRFARHDYPNRLLAGALVGALVAFAGVRVVGAQERRTPQLSRPPTGGDFSAPPKERAETREFLDNARRLYDQAYRLRETAEALRDRNRYDEAEAYEDRAKDMEEQARGYERRAEESRLPTTKRRPTQVEE